MPDQTEIFLFNNERETLEEALLVNPILENHLNDFEELWIAFRNSKTKTLPKEELPQSSHWNWRHKIDQIKGLLAFPSFAIECNGETQGLMIANMTKVGKLDSQKNKPLVYIEFLETAPWNTGLATKPKYKGIGTIMIETAIQLSFDEGFHGRIGLESLPQSEGWYEHKLKMTKLGKKTDSNLMYFEMTPDQALRFMEDN